MVYPVHITVNLVHSVSLSDGGSMTGIVIMTFEFDKCDVDDLKTRFEGIVSYNGGKPLQFEFGTSKDGIDIYAAFYGPNGPVWDDEVEDMLGV